MNHKGLVSLSATLGLLILAPATSAQTALYELGGEATGSGFGATTALLGDIDNDGFDDFAIGAPNASTITPFEGSASIFSGQTGVLIHEVHGTAPFGFLGSALGAAPDFDGDGHDEFLIGVRGDDTKGTNAGVVLVYSGATGTLYVEAYGDAPGDALGSSLAVVGDVDGDGVDDIAVGMPGSDVAVPDGGGFRVYSGLTAATIFNFYGGILNERLGAELGAAGDVDGDGRADILVASDAGPLGRVHIISGRSQQILYTLLGSPGPDDFGRSMAGIGDADGDGVDDVVVGSPLANTGIPSGAARVFSGATGAELYFVSGDASGDMLGTSVAAAGDVDGDGRADFAVGMPGHDALMLLDDGTGGPLTLGLAAEVGQVRIYSGGTGQLLFSVDGDTEGGLFGWALANVGDTNLDGAPELVSGALLADYGTPQAGSARVFSTRPQPLAADMHLVSLSAGGRQNLSIDMPSSSAGKLYLVVGGGSGTFPGVPTAVGQLHLNLDDYSTITLTLPGAGIVLNPLGTLDSNGDAGPYIDISPDSDSSFVGVTLYHAAAIFDPTTFALEFVTNTVPLTAGE